MSSTEQNGYATQFLANPPFGETLAEQWFLSGAEGQNSTSYHSPFKFSAKEKDIEMRSIREDHKKISTPEQTGYSYFGARYYSPELSIWLSVDPMASEFPWQSPYTSFDNNPINKIDPTGMAAVDWKPEVDEKGNTSYVAEQGDNAATLADQFGLTQQQADRLVGGREVKAGETRIAGEEAKSVTGSDVLKLDLNSQMATDQRIIDQAVFAMDHSKKKGDLGFYSTGYFGGTKYKNVVNASGSITIDGRSIPLELQLPLYRSATFDGSSKSIFLGNNPYTIKQTSGTRFPQTDLLLFDMYHPNTKNRMGDYRILSPRNGSDKIYNRLKN